MLIVAEGAAPDRFYERFSDDHAFLGLDRIGCTKAAHRMAFRAADASVIISVYMSQRVELKTRDNLSIIGDYYAATDDSAKGLLLLHMMPAVRGSWRTLAEKVQAAGWHTLAIDLRGHGESGGGPEGYRTFSNAEHQASRSDLEAGVQYLESHGVHALALGGASIDANLCLVYLAEHPEARAAFLLSPGLDYRGIETEAAAKRIRPGQAVFYVASRDDVYSAETVQRFFDATPTGVAREIKLFDTAGHGTTIFEREPSFLDAVIAWLERVSR